MQLAFDVEETAKIIGESVHSVRRLDKSGKLKRVGDGTARAVRFSIFEIARYLETTPDRIQQLLSRGNSVRSAVDPNAQANVKYFETSARLRA